MNVPKKAAEWVNAVALTIMALTFGAAMIALVTLNEQGTNKLFWLFPTSAALACLTNLYRHRPGQNVVLSAATLALPMWFLLLAMSTPATGPLAIRFEQLGGPALPGKVPLTLPLTLFVALVSARGVARLVLRSRRPLGRFGYETVSLSAALSAVFFMGLDGTARAQGWWTYESRLMVVMLPAVLALLFLVLLGLASVFLINKKPGPEPIEAQSVITWCLLNQLAAGWAYMGKAWMSAALHGVLLVTGAGLCLWAYRREMARISPRP